MPPLSATRAALAYKKNPPPPQETITDHHGRDKPAGHRPPRPGRGTSSLSSRETAHIFRNDGDPPNAAPVFPLPPKLSFPGDIPTTPHDILAPAASKHIHIHPQTVPLPRTRRAPTSFRPHHSRLHQCLTFALLHPGACGGAIPLLHVPAAVSANFRLIVDTGSPDNIHNNAADLFDTSPSDKVFITADGPPRVPSTCVGKLPLILTDTLGCQSFFALYEVHAVPSFEYTLLSIASLVSNGASVQINPDCECIVLPAANQFTVTRTIPLRKAADGLYLVDVAIANESDIRKPGIHVLGAFRDPHTFQHLAALPADKLATAIFCHLPFGAEKLRCLADTASDVPRGIAQGTPRLAPEWAIANAKFTLHGGHLRQRSERTGDLIHLDVCGPFNHVVGRGNAKYFAVFVDDHSDYTHV